LDLKQEIQIQIQIQVKLTWQQIVFFSFLNNWSTVF
jgi:hypothetical protein